MVSVSWLSLVRFKPYHRMAAPRYPGRPRSFGRNAGVADQAGPAGDIALHQGAGLRCVERQRPAARLDEGLPHVGRRGDGGQVRAQALEHFRRRRGRREQAEPRFQFQLRHAALAHGGQVRMRGIARPARGGKRFHASARNLPRRRRRQVEEQVDAAAEQVLVGGLRAAIRHMDQFHPGQVPQRRGEHVLPEPLPAEA